jgi:hypothetical protein
VNASNNLAPGVHPYDLQPRRAAPERVAPPARVEMATPAQLQSAMRQWVDDAGVEALAWAMEHPIPSTGGNGWRGCCRIFTRRTRIGSWGSGRTSKRLDGLRGKHGPRAGERTGR